MSDQRSRMGAANLSLPLMIVTFVMIAGFLWWLNKSAESASVVIDEQTTSVEGPSSATGGAVTRVTEEQLRLDPQAFEGQVLEVTDDVAMGLGSQAFFLDFLESPFLVILNEELVQQGQAVPAGSVTVTGPLMVMNDSIIENWMGRGLVPANDRILLEFSTHFIEARSVSSPEQP